MDPAFFPPDVGPRPFRMIDAGRPPRSRPDGGLPLAICRPQMASVATCPEVLCDGPSLWYWNGDSCFEAPCGACRGSDCGADGFSSQLACEDAHAPCDATLCRSTGGQWAWWTTGCGYPCGQPTFSCAESMPSCDCGPTRAFVSGVGCMPDPGCSAPAARPRDELCRATSGTWGPICCDSVCGQPCADACIADACDCGVGRIFDAERGCIESAQCYEPALGQICDGGARCPAGTLCCMRCGGAGCVSPATCIAPVCDGDPNVDECGNDRFPP